MSKGSGRRRITPSDGLRYDPDTDMTNIEVVGGSHRQSAKKELLLGIRTGAQPTTKRHYGNRGLRRGGVGRKDDNRSWKTSSRGKQYEKNLDAREEQKTHRPVPDKVAARSREKSINADLLSGYPCKVGSHFGRMIPLRDIVSVADRFLLKFGGEMYRGYAERRAQPYQFNWSGSSSYYNTPRVKAAVHVPLTGFALFEQRAQRIIQDVANGIVDSFGNCFSY